MEAKGGKAMKVPMAIQGLLILNLMLPLLSCNNQSTKSKPLPTDAKPATLDSTLISNLAATVDGGAYAGGFGGVWYLRGAEATRVKEIATSLPGPTGQPAPETEGGSDAFNQQLLLEITPALDGGAYAKSIIPRGVWFLRGAEAIRVKEVPSLSGSLSMTTVTDREKGLFVFAQHQAAKRKECETK